MPIVTAYQQNPWWTWADFGITGIVELVSLIIFVVLLVWAIYRYKIVRRVKGLFIWMVTKPNVPLSVIPLFQRNIDKPLRQDALRVLDDLPELSNEVKQHIMLWEDYLEQLKQFQSDEMQPSYEVYLKYRTWRMQNPGQNLTLKEFFRQYLQLMQQASALPQQAYQRPLPSAPVAQGTPFAPAPTPGIAFNPSLAAQIVGGQR